MSKFSLSENFISKYKRKKPPFGFNGLGELVYYRTYSRIKDDGKNERWWETIKRVVEGTYNIQKDWIEQHRLEWNPQKSQFSAQEMYDRMFHMKILPPGRGLFAQGSDIISKKRLTPALFNCCFVSTENIAKDPSYPFMFAKDMLMLGVGMGVDLKGAGTIDVREPSKEEEIFVIPDTREGWVESLGLVIGAYFGKNKTPIMDYSLIRPAGSPIKTFGGTASGSAPLKEFHSAVCKTLDKNVGSLITQTTIADIFNLTGKVVVAGNTRRSAILIAGDTSEEFLNLKNYEVNPGRVDYGWSSNNSVNATLGMDYKDIAESIRINGEPGLLWLENAHNNKRMGDTSNGLQKDDRTQATNPCGEIFLESAEKCVAGDTRLQLKSGNAKIKNIVGKEVEIWNGENWSKVTPFKTSTSSKLLRITMTDGSVLETTDYHRFSALPSGSVKFKTVKASELRKGYRLPDFTLGGIEGEYYPNAFEYGLMAGDGCVYKENPIVTLCGDKVKLKNLNVKGKWGKPQIKKECKDPINRLYLKSVLDVDKSTDLRKMKGLPDFVFTMDKKSILEFTAGYIETDGTVLKNKYTEHYVLYGKELQMKDMQVLLRRVGINYTAAFECSPKGFKTNKGIRNYALWGLRIHSHDCKSIPTRLKKIRNFGTGYSENNAYKDSKPVSNKKHQSIRSIEELPGTHPTFCFYEPLTGMGVFGNSLTFQCNLCEVFPDKHESKEDFITSLKYAYLYSKTVTLLNTHWPQTNAVMLRNRRVGTSVSGIAQFLTNQNLPTLREWLNDGYDALKEYDKIYSNWLAIPRSIRITTNKPSGSISLLNGSTPGIHYPESRFYIRRMRIGNHSQLLSPLEKAGYTVEPAVGQEESTSVVEIPVDVGSGIRPLNEVTMWEQLELAAFMSENWADNAVSVTVTFNPETEGHDIERALEHYQYKLKSVSFLPRTKIGAYAQMPYESIDEDTYNKMTQSLSKLSFGTVKDEEANVEKFCNNDTCEII